MSASEQDDKMRDAAEHRRVGLEPLPPVNIATKAEAKAAMHKYNTMEFAQWLLAIWNTVPPELTTCLHRAVEAMHANQAASNGGGRAGQHAHAWALLHFHQRVDEP